MNKTSFVFLGAGPVAAKSLKELNKFFYIEVVVSKKTPLHHKADGEVQNLAKELGLPTILVSNKTELDDAILANSFKSKVGVLIDFGIIVSESVIKHFENGIVNSHFSRLPEWRGADPITYSLLSGQKQTGVSLMLLTKGMDEGPILDIQSLDIEKHETGNTLTDKLINLSNQMLKKELPKYIQGLIKPVDQIRFAEHLGIPSKPTYSNKVTKSEGIIDWMKDAETIEREIRAFQPWPKSHTEIGKNLIITVFKAGVNKSIQLNPGQVKVDGNSLLVGTSSSSIELLEVQPWGKKIMTTADFIRGYSNKLFVQIS